MSNLVKWTCKDNNKWKKHTCYEINEEKYNNYTLPRRRKKIHGKNEKKLKNLCKNIYSKLIKEANQGLSHTH
jgi:hypothetical protein